jgi:hypothetical protein
MKKTVCYVVMLFAAGILATSSTVACGGDDDDGGAAANIQFRGDYRPTTPGGAIGLLSFKSKEDYRLTPSSCTEEACVESGTFTFDAKAKSLHLKNGKTGVTRTLPVKVISTSKASQSGLITTKTGGKQLLDSTGGDLVKEGQKTTENTNQQLVDFAKALLEVIQQANVDNQEMKNDQAQEEADKAKAEAEADKAKSEADKAKAEAEKAQAEAEKAKAEAAARDSGTAGGGGGGGGGGADDDNGTGDQKGGAAGGGG